MHVKHDLRGGVTVMFVTGMFGISTTYSFFDSGISCISISSADDDEDEDEYIDPIDVFSLNRKRCGIPLDRISRPLKYITSLILNIMVRGLQIVIKRGAKVLLDTSTDKVMGQITKSAGKFAKGMGKIHDHDCMVLATVFSGVLGTVGGLYMGLTMASIVVLVPGAWEQLLVGFVVLLPPQYFSSHHL